MADGLSVAASVAGLIQIADIVVRRGYRYVRDVQNAEKSVERLIDEVNKLSGILHSLKNVAERCEDDKLEIEPTTQIHHIEACLKTLQLVDTHLEVSNPATQNDPMDNLKQKLKWPLNRSKVKELMAEVEKHKSVMNLAMTASSMSALLVLLDRQESIKDNLLELKAGIERDRAKRVRIEMSDQRRRWLSALSPVDAQKWQDTNIKLRQPGSGIWFTDGPEFREWLSTKRSKLWVHGIPGAGKTILMASAIQEAMKHTDETHALAYFYADYKVTATHDPKNILGALAKQIAMQNEQCFSTLHDFWGTPGSPGRMNSSSGEFPTMASLSGLLMDLSTHFEDVMIIVDGLDEIAVDRSEVADMLQNLNHSDGNVKTLFASRKEVDLEYPLHEFKELSIAAMSSDLRLYVASEIERRTRNRSLRIQDPELKEHIMRTLVGKADGMFRWVACQLDYLEECTSDRERREALSKLPPDLPSSYERILDRINNSRNRKNQRLVVRTLQWILYAQWPLSSLELLEALSVDEGDVTIDASAMTTENDVLHWASSLIRRNNAGGLEIAHFTVKEFLVAIDYQRTPQFAPYLMLQEDAEVQLARICLTFLNCRPFSEFAPKSPLDLLTIVESHPFLPYATVNWDCHSLYHMDDAIIMLLARELFHPSVSKQFNLYRLVRHVREWDPITFTFPREDQIEVFRNIDLLKFKDSNPLHWAAYLGLESLCNWLISEGLSVHQMSCVGTPLNCAMLGHYAIRMYREEDLDDNPKFTEDFGGITFEEPGDILDPRPKHRPRLEVMHLLLRNGASPFARTSPILDMLPLAVAVRTFYPDRCTALVAAGARFSDDDLWVIKKSLDDGKIGAMADHIVGQTFESLDIVLPEAYETLFYLAATYRSNHGDITGYDDTDCKRAEALLANLSSYPDALEWAAYIDYTIHDVLFLYPLLAKMQRTLTSLEPFPSGLRKLVVEAVKRYDTRTISKLLEKDTNALSSLTEEGDSMLHLAVADKEKWCAKYNSHLHSELVTILVKSGQSVIEQNDLGETPLHLAAKYGDLEVFELLLRAELGRELELLQSRTHAGLTAYDYAIEAGSSAIVEFLQLHEQLLQPIQEDVQGSKGVQMEELFECAATALSATPKRAVAFEEDHCMVDRNKKLRS